MTAMTKAPPVRKVFQSTGDEFSYLHERLLYWFYERGNRARALTLSGRLSTLLAQDDPGQESILGQECRALLAELHQDLPLAIHHRESEVEKILKLWSTSRDHPLPPSVAERYGIDALVDRFDLLAMLYHDVGNLDLAILTLVRSEALCEQFQVPFLGAELLRDYLAEKNREILSNVLISQGRSTRSESSHVPPSRRASASRGTRPARPRRNAASR
jgi:hypothetical protein